MVFDEQPIPEPNDEDLGSYDCYEDDVNNLIGRVRLLLHSLGKSHEHYLPLMEAVTQVEAWESESDDPRENGWVGDDGRP